MIILFDGVCNLCNGFVNFIIDKDTNAVFRFATLQSDYGQKFLKENKGILLGKDSVILITHDKILTESDAAFEILSCLKHLRWLVYLKIFPKNIRDTFYKFVAKNRYRCFGKKATCRIPTPELKDRFL